MNNNKNNSLEFYLAKNKSGKFYIAGNNASTPLEVDKRTNKNLVSKKDKSDKYQVVPIGVFSNKKPLEFKTPQDDDMSDYFTNINKALAEDKKNIARTYVVTDPDMNKVFGYYTLRVACLNSENAFFNGESNAYEGCNDISGGYIPVIELLMFAKNFNDDFKIKMKDVFFKNIAKRIFKIYQEIGIVYLYLECSADNKELKQYYSGELKLMPYPDTTGLLKKNNLAGYIQRIEFIKNN